DAAKGAVFRNARVRHSVEPFIEQFLLLLCRQLAIMRNANVLIVRHQVEDVLFEIGTGAADCMNFVLSDHLSQRNAELSSAHRPSHGEHHLATLLQVLDVSLSCILNDSCVEVSVVMIDKSFDAHFFPPTQRGVVTRLFYSRGNST